MYFNGEFLALFQDLSNVEQLVCCRASYTKATFVFTYYGFSVWKKVLSAKVVATLQFVSLLIYRAKNTGVPLFRKPFIVPDGSNELMHFYTQSITAIFKKFSRYIVGSWAFEIFEL